MPRPAPPAAAEENTLVLHAIRGLVSRHDVLRRLTPNQTFSARTSSPVLLGIDGAKESVTCKADAEYGGQVGSRGRCLVQAKVLCLESVGSGEEAKTAPGQVESIVVVRDVYGA